MNIEEAIDILVPKENIDLSNHFNNTRFFKAINTLLIAYKKEKGENVELRLQDIPFIEGELKAYKDRVNELKQQLEKEKEKNNNARYYIIDKLNNDYIINIGIDDMKIILDILEE